MKHCIINGMAVLAMIFSFAACENGGNTQTAEQSTGKKFAPQERTSSMTAEERNAAIAQKKAELNVDIETLLDSRNLRISILQPIVKGDITDAVADRLSMKMLEIAAQNGISGLGTNPNIVMGAEIAQTGRAATGTAPQKMTVQYELLFKVMNAVTGDVYGVSKQEVMGVGNSFEEASLNAMNEIKNTPEIQAFLNTSSERIINWYNENVVAIKNEVEKAEAEGDFDYALAILGSVPEQATVAYQYVTEKQPKTLTAMLHKHAADMLGEVETALASSGDEFNPAVSAYFSLIPTDCPEHATAQKLYAEYERKCNARRAALEAKAERDEQAARELEKLKMQYENKEALAQIEAEKYKAQVEAKATAAASRNRPRGLFGALGYAVTEFTDAIFHGDEK
jgi:hypothetical protein